MKTAFVALALVLLHQGLASAVSNPAECPGAADSSCSAFSSLQILVTAGKCSGTASADCRTVSDSQDQFVEAFNEWWGEEGVCDSGKAEVAAEAIAVATAKVWANSAAKVTCDGQGFACGWSIANGNTYALAFAESIAQAAAEVGGGTTAEAFCFADIRAVTGVFAEAAAQAQADVCTTGGTEESFQKSYVESVQVGLARAFAKATASACSADGEALASSECSGNAESTADGTVSKAGDACGGLAQLKACTGKVKNKCCSPNYRRTLCTCRNCEGPWFRRSSTGAAKKSFANNKGDLCFCIDTEDDGVDEEAPEEAEEETPVEPSPKEITPIDEPTETPAEPSPKEIEEPVTEPTKEETEKPAPKVEEPEEKLGQQVLGDKATVTCPGAAETSCSAFAGLEILVTGGRCSGTAKADCKAVNESQNDFQEAFDDWWGEEGMCDSGKAEAASVAVAKAIAKVWANAAVKVTCEGHGFACGWSIADGKSWAIGFAEAIAQASAEASTGETEGFCFADIRSLASVIAEAASKAQSDACTTGGTVEDFETSYASAIQIGVARAFAKATASACSEHGEAAASSECSGSAESTREGDSFAYGDACAGIAQIKACTGAGKAMCCDSGFRRKLCSCSRKGCANGPWIKKSEHNAKKNTKRSFEDRKKNVCFCVD